MEYCFDWSCICLADSTAIIIHSELFSCTLHFSPLVGKLGVYDADGDGDFDVDDAKVLLGKYIFCCSR